MKRIFLAIFAIILVATTGSVWADNDENGTTADYETTATSDSDESPDDEDEDEDDEPEVTVTFSWHCGLNYYQVQNGVSNTRGATEDNPTLWPDRWIMNNPTIVLAHITVGGEDATLKSMRIDASKVYLMNGDSMLPYTFQTQFTTKSGAQVYSPTEITEKEVLKLVIPAGAMTVTYTYDDTTYTYTTDEDLVRYYKIGVAKYACSQDVDGYKTDLFDYNASTFEKYTYTWTDDDGNEVTSNLAEPATEPAQMKALLVKVLTEAEIPGLKGRTILESIDGSTEDGNQDYFYSNATTTRYEKSWSVIGLSSMAAGEPTLDEATALLVKMKEFKDGDSSFYNNPWDSIESISVITSRERISDGINPGYLFNIDDDISIFFVITKGRMRYGYVENTYGYGYEVLAYYMDRNDTGISQQFKNGDKFIVDHDCCEVHKLGHYIGLNGTSTEKEMHNMFFYLPDKRDLNWTLIRSYDLFGFNSNSSVCRDYSTNIPFTYYNYYYAPYFFDYSISLNASLQQDKTWNENYTQYTQLATVSWTSSYKDITETSNPERFYLYRVDEETGESELVDLSEVTIPEDQSEYTTIDAENNCIFSTLATVTVYVEETAGLESSTITYYVSGRPESMEEISLARSNTDEVTLAGTDSYEALNLSIAANYHSAYNYDASYSTPHNIYVNDLTVSDNSNDTDIDISAGNVSVGSDFLLRRQLLDTNGDPMEITDVLKISITAKELVTADGDVTENRDEAARYRYAYSLSSLLSEDEQAWHDEVSADLKTTAPAKTGYLYSDLADSQSDDASMPIYADSDSGAFFVVRDVRKVLLVNNDHPVGCNYRIYYFPSGYTDDADAALYSNRVNIPAIKSDIDAYYYTYSYNGVKGSTVPDFVPQALEINLELIDNVRVVGYSLMLSNDNGSSFSEIVNASQVGTSSDYFLKYSLTNESLGTCTFGAEENKKWYPILYDPYTDYDYGFDIDEGSLLAVDIKTQPAGADYYNHYGTPVVTMPGFPTTQMYVESDGSEIKLYVTGDAPDGGYTSRGNTVYKPAGARIWRVKDPDVEINEYSWASLDTELVLDAPFGMDNENFDVEDDSLTEKGSYCWIVNQYWRVDTVESEDSTEAAAKSPYRASDSDSSDDANTEDSIYVYTVAMYGAYFSGDTITGIDDIVTDVTDTSAKYCNLQGHPIDNPTPGELVIRLSDQSASKIIFPQR